MEDLMNNEKLREQLRNERFTSKEDLIAACQALGTLKTTSGVYYAFGNHDKGYYDQAYRGYSGDDLIAELYIKCFITVKINLQIHFATCPL